MIRKSRAPSHSILLFACLGLLCAASALADWVPADGHKMHFPQLPDETGWDVNATAPMVLAEDFMCTQTGWIKDIHFWGSWKDGVPGQIQYFILSLHRDIPKNPPNVPYSRPGPVVWERRISNFLIKQIDPPTSEGWYDPSTGQVLPNNHQQYFQYNIFLNQTDWFQQDSGTIYWLNISAVVAPEPVPKTWGWKSTKNHWNDDAVWGTSVSTCISPDNGTGTASQPSLCRYIPLNEVMKITNGLAPGDEIMIETELVMLSLTSESPGGSLGGTHSESQAELHWHMVGTGSLSGYVRDMVMPLSIFETDQGPRAPGTSPQSFPTDLFRKFGQLPIGDPDFDLLRIVGGTDFGMPSPGHTTLTKLPSGDWNVESFFDITYRIDFIGAPGGPLAGRSGSTTATIRLSQGSSTPTTWTDMYEPQPPPILNTYNVVVDPNGQFAGGSGSDAYGVGWFTYPSRWINVWFYDHPFDTSRFKKIHIEFDLIPFQIAFPSVITVAVNWSTDIWSLSGNPPGPRRPPLPGEDEALYIGRDILHQGTDPTGHYVFDYIIPTYNPEWVSIDVQGRNFIVSGGILHECLPKNPPISLDLSFVITNGGGTTPTGACCYPNPLGFFDCTVTTQSNCVTTLNGVYQGDNTACGGIQACCLPNGVCANVDVLCCQAMGGQPQPVGTTCTAPEACCLTNGACIDADPLCCRAVGGLPQGPGSKCATPQPCCLPSGQCAMLDPLCCLASGGQPSPVPCQPVQACCLPTGQCINADPNCCQMMGGLPQGPGTSCATVTCGGGQPEACCLATGACVMLIPATCVAQGGTPQGPGTTCTVPQACCLPNGQCANLDPLCCIQQGGQPIPGAVCTVPQACCLPNGQCANLDPLCCQRLNGVPHGPGTQCTAPRVCCLPNGQCIFVDPLCCRNLQGSPKGATASCTTVPSPCCCIGNTGNVDCDPANGTDISDLTALIDYLYITFTPLCCPDAANTDGQSGTDISDLTALIDYLYISFTSAAPCP